MLLSTLARLLASAHAATAFTFAAPFQESEWVVLGDALVLDGSVQLAGTPGQSGGVWTKELVPYPEWTLEAVLQTVSDGAAGDSGFALWYTAKPNPKGALLGGDDAWDGLAVFMDTRDPNGDGEVRGHLNDGSYRLLQSPNVQTDALSLCRVPFRRATGPITLRVGYSSAGFAVDVNGQRCFRSTDVVLPPGFFGISAAAGSTGDKLYLREASVRPGMDAALEKLLTGAEAGAPEVQQFAPLAEQPRAAPAAPVAPHAADAGGVAADDVVAGVRELLAPQAQRAAGLEQHLKQLDERLTRHLDALAVSLSDVASRQRQAESGGAEHAAGQELVHDELRALRLLVEETQKIAAAAVDTAHAAQRDAPRPPTLGKIALVVLLVQLGLLFLLRLLKRRGVDHQKLL